MTGKNYYSQVFLEKCKNVVKGKKIPKYIIDNTEISSDSVEKILMKKLRLKKILMKKILMNRIQMKKIKKQKKLKKLFLYIKMVNDYYQKKNKEKLVKEARERNQNLSEEEKDKKRQYASE